MVSSKDNTFSLIKVHLKENPLRSCAELGQLLNLSDDRIRLIMKENDYDFSAKRKEYETNLVASLLEKHNQQISVNNILIDTGLNANRIRAILSEIEVDRFKDNKYADLNIAKVVKLTIENPSITTKEISSIVNLSIGTVTKYLRFGKRTKDKGKWVDRTDDSEDVKLVDPTDTSEEKIVRGKKEVKYFEYNGETNTVYGFAKKYAIKCGTLQKRITKLRMNIKEAIEYKRFQ